MARLGIDPPPVQQRAYLSPRFASSETFLRPTVGAREQCFCITANFRKKHPLKESRPLLSSSLKSGFDAFRASESQSGARKAQTSELQTSDFSLQPLFFFMSSPYASAVAEDGTIEMANDLKYQHGKVDPGIETNIGLVEAVPSSELKWGESQYGVDTLSSADDKEQPSTSTKTTDMPLNGTHFLFMPCRPSPGTGSK